MFVVVEMHAQTKSTGVRAVFSLFWNIDLQSNAEQQLFEWMVLIWIWAIIKVSVTLSKSIACSKL